MAAAAAAVGLTTLSHRLIRQFAATKDGSNLVFSPLCIYSALSQMAVGARGSTLSELVDVLGARCCEKGLAEDATSDMVQLALAGGGPHPGDLQTAFACGLWHDATRTKLKPAYRDVAGNHSIGLTGAVDFFTRPEEARTHINTWVEAATGGFVDSILHPGSVDKETRLVHTSAFSLEAFWETPFHRWRNKYHKFHRLDGSAAIDTLFMHSYEDQFVATHQGFKVLRMPYMLQLHDHHSTNFHVATRTTTARYSMCVFLPDARDGLSNLVEQITSSPGFLQEHLPVRRVNVGEFRLPKFKVSLSSCSLKQVLQGLGIRALFGTGADMLDMLDYDPGEPIYVSDMLHEAVIAVDEEGTEAADPCACTLCTSCLWPESRRPGCVDFVADHPFVFFVLEELTGAILLAGHVLHPTQG